MSSFATHRLRALDPTRAPRRRFAALRTCVTEFAPYGFRATFDHLARTARIPADPERDPDAVVRAVEELHAAREIWLAAFRPWQELRRAQKRAGVRAPRPPEPWRRLHCPDPGFHPDAPLPVVMPSILRAGAGPWPPPVCPVCARDRGTRELRTGHGVYRLCAGCGVGLGGRDTGFEPAVAAAREERWKSIWLRRT
ncbi:hypothetical protein ACFWHQ_36725 [Streptomyces sp. NPDC060334]|uniref:hypothetical protein n=1 Tax=Streptomyces sp. NPDC060334 TaxID=3347099 RepID=UPI00365026F8